VPGHRTITFQLAVPSTNSKPGRTFDEADGRSGDAVWALWLSTHYGPDTCRINHKRVERIWRLKGLKVPQKQSKRGRLWRNDDSCVRLRPDHRNHVWGYDFVMDNTNDGQPFRMRNLIDESTRECLAIQVGRKLKAGVVQECLTELF